MGKAILLPSELASIEKRVKQRLGNGKENQGYRS